VIFTSPSGLVTISGGKWTTMRKMAEDVVDVAVRNAGLQASSCRTENV
jgi:glycerol-3-phosphate dehydrogenase